ncbi:MAG: hypothetical protein LBH43_10005 [Treponema sp.]|jgi:hypothetical protein|nr:hypothetical protein [Treponema sp.]
MEISALGEMSGLIFWPEEAVYEAFEKVIDAVGNPDELEQLRTFYREMKFFYDASSATVFTVPPRVIAALYGYAKKGFEAEEQYIRPGTMPENSGILRINRKAPNQYV